MPTELAGAAPQSDQLTKEVKALARQLGFADAGITTAEPFLSIREVLLERIERGLMGGLTWFTADRARFATDVKQLVPEAHSIIALTVPYLGRAEYLPSTPGKPRGRVARYAWGRDYHQVVLRQTARFIAELRARYGHTEARKGMADRARVVDRAVAQRAGVGWYGKNTCILTPSHGSWVLLAEVVTNLELVPDRALRTHCGACARCMPACPTGAIIGPGVLDVGRCISYLTIEERGTIPLALRPLMGDWIFGCDVCQEVCPVNVSALPTAWVEFSPEYGIGPSPELLPLLQLSPEAFNTRFQGTPIARAKRSGLLRNVCIALGNIGDGASISSLAAILRHDDDPLVRSHAAWALGRFDDPAARAQLEQQRYAEPDVTVREELTLALERPEH